MTDLTDDLSFHLATYELDALLEGERPAAHCIMCGDTRYVVSNGVPELSEDRLRAEIDMLRAAENGGDVPIVDAVPTSGTAPGFERMEALPGFLRLDEDDAPAPEAPAATGDSFQAYVHAFTCQRCGHVEVYFLPPIDPRSGDHAPEDGVQRDAATGDVALDITPSSYGPNTHGENTRGENTRGPSTCGPSPASHRATSASAAGSPVIGEAKNSAARAGDDHK